MNARVERTVPAKAVRTEQVIIDFQAERLKAPFLLRCGAILVDYILLIFIPVGSLLIGRLMNIESSKLLNSEISNTGWLIMILLALTNFVIFPMFSGQSVGKMLTGLRVVRTDGKAASFSQLLVRHSIGYLLTIATLGLGFLFSILNQKGRALHDFLVGTVVVYGRRRTERKEI